MKKLMLAVAILAAAWTNPVWAQGGPRSPSVFRPVTSYAIDATGTSITRSATFGQFVFVARLVSTLSFFFTLGVTPLTATTSDTFVPPNTPTVVGVDPGDYIAVIGAWTPSGSAARITIWITEMR